MNKTRKTYKTTHPSEFPVTDESKKITMTEQIKTVAEFNETIIKAIESEINSIQPKGEYQEGLVAGLRKSLDLIKEEFDIYTGDINDVLIILSKKIKSITDKYLNK